MNLPKTIDGKKVNSGPPLLFSLAHAGIARNIPGSWRLLEILQKTLLKNNITAYVLKSRTDTAPSVTDDHNLHQDRGLITSQSDTAASKDVVIFAPLGRPESSRTFENFDLYEEYIVLDMVHILNKRKTLAPVWYVDAGADIGMVAAQMIRHVHDLEHVFAFEPNNFARTYLTAFLSHNISTFDVSECAVGNRNARGRMVSPASDPSDHACFFQEDQNGPIKMVPLSSLPPPQNKTVILKVDVEGTENEVIEGARSFLAAAQDFIVTFEAHPGVISRTGIEPDAVFKLLKEISNCKIHLAGDIDLVFDETKPICEQIPDFENNNHNLICTSIID